MSWLRRIFPGPQSLMMLARRRRPASNLYLVEVDFPLDEKQRKAIEDNLERLSEKHGLDFFLCEPGFKLKRFEDI